jgi:ketosteroid isomerase-like protein
MNSIVTTFFFLSAFFPAALRVERVSTAAATSAQVNPSVVEGADKYLRSVLAGDVSAVVGLFGADAVLMPPDHPLLRGRTAIDHYYREWFKGPAKVTAFAFTHMESPVLGDMAFDVGTYTQALSLGANGTVNASGNYMVILRRAGTGWEIAYLIFNDAPSKTPPTFSGADSSRP